MYFIFAFSGHVPLVDCVPLVASAPVALIGDASPAASSTGTPVAGAIYWNSFDSANGNSFIYDSNKICLVSNSDSVDSVTVTVITKGATVNTFAQTTADFTITVAPGELCIVPNLPNLFNDGDLVKMTIAEVAGTAITDTRIAVVKIT